MELAEATTFPTPFAEYEGEVLPGWIDSNDHMNLAYYVVLFDNATDAIYDALGLGAAEYKAATNHGTFAVETHTLYDRELRLGAQVRVVTHVLGVDAKRLHLAHEMFRLSDGERAAAQEIMFLHVDLGSRRVVPWPAHLHARMQQAAQAHAVLKRPDWVGRRVAMP
jgi:acyl-CoA thioester hydrolase